VERPLHRADRPGDRRRDVGSGRDDHPGREGRGVEAVLGAHDEVRIERPGRAVVRPRTRHLVEEARDEVERGVRLDRLLAAPQPGERGQGRRHERRQGACLLRGRWPWQVLRRSPRRHGGAQRVHRLGRRRQGSQDREHRRRERRGRQVMLRIPVAGPEQVRDGGIRAVRDEIPDAIAPVQQPSALAIDVGEAGLTGDDAFEAGGVGPGRLGCLSRRRVGGRGVGHGLMVAVGVGWRTAGPGVSEVAAR
jgi:hypothetical protein